MIWTRWPWWPWLLVVHLWGVRHAKVSLFFKFVFSLSLLHSMRLAQFHQSSHHHYWSRDGITCSLLETGGCRQILGGAPTHCVVATFGRACAANFNILNAFWGLTLSIYFLLSRKRAKLERWWGDRASVEGKSGETDGSVGRPGTSCWWCTPCNIDLRFFTTFCPWIWKFIHEYESLSMNMKVWHAESWPKHLGSSDGSGESSAISAVGSDSTILPSPFESSRFCAGYRQCPLRQFSGSVSAGELSHFQELMTMAHLLGNSPPQIPKPTILRTSPASHLQNLEFV